MTPKQTPPAMPDEGAHIYLAARFSRRHECHALGQLLQARGAIITSRWTKPECDHVVPAGSSKQAADAERERFALEDMDDIRAADWTISLMEEPRSNGRGGRHVEFGIAAALGHRLTIIGPRETVFHHLPNVEHFDTIEAFVASLPAALARKASPGREGVLREGRPLIFHDSAKYEYRMSRLADFFEANPDGRVSIANARQLVEDLRRAAANPLPEASPGREGVLREAYPVEERAFHVVIRDKGEPTEAFVARDRATLAGYPARDRQDAYAMAASLNSVVRHHVRRAEALAANPLPEAPRHHPEYLRGIQDGTEACERAVFRAFDQEPDGTPIASFALRMSARLEKAEAPRRDDGEVKRLRIERAAWRQLAINEGWSHNLERAYGREEYARGREAQLDELIAQRIANGLHEDAATDPVQP